MRTVFYSLIAVLALAGCAKPDPPKLTPERAKVTSVTATGIGFELELDAYNPNAVTLSTRKVDAKVTLDGKYDMGKVTVATPLELPAKKHTKLTVPVSTKWSDLSSVAALAASNRTVPYRVDGTVQLGGDTLNVDVPFHMDGTVTHEQLVQATLNSLPKIPGLNLP